jgi:hypothetical protein
MAEPAKKKPAHGERTRCVRPEEQAKGAEFSSL